MDGKIDGLMGVSKDGAVSPSKVVACRDTKIVLVRTCLVNLGLLMKKTFGGNIPSKKCHCRLIGNDKQIIILNQYLLYEQPLCKAYCCFFYMGNLPMFV